MTSPRDIILHRRSSIANKRPLISDLSIGEIAVNYHKDDISLYVRDTETNIRKIGGVWYSETPPDPSIHDSAESWQTLSHGEIWIKPLPAIGETDPNTGAKIYIWNTNLNSGSGDWVLSGEGVFSILDGYLDQFKEVEDGEDYIHTNRNQLKINNKSALRGYATTIPSDNETDITKANTLVINDQHNFATGVTLNANNLIIDSTSIEASSNSTVLNADTPFSFQTDSVSGIAESTFSYVAHGLFNGEEVFVDQFLNDGVTPSGITQGNYTIAEASLNTFKLFDGAANVLSTGNIKINYFPQVILDQSYNVTQSGNFKVKSLSETPDSSQIEDGRWDLYQNTSNGNVRIFARTSNKLSQPDASVVSIPIKNGDGVAIAKGDPVYLIGNDPIRKIITVGKADGSNPLKMSAIGVSQGDLQPNEIGDLTILGPLEIDTSIIDGATSGDDTGKTVYVKQSGGGLTLEEPDADTGEYQKIGILFQDDATSGSLYINHPDLVLSLPPLGNNYVWVGDTNNKALASRLNANSLVTSVLGGVPEISLAPEIKFGGYEFLWDSNQSSSKLQTKISSTSVPLGNLNEIIVDSFPTTYRSAKLFVQVTGNSSVDIPVNFQITELLIIHNGNNVSVTDYATASIPHSGMGDFSANINGGNVEVVFSSYGKVEGDIEIKALRTSVLS